MNDTQLTILISFCVSVSFGAGWLLGRVQILQLLIESEREIEATHDAERRKEINHDSK